MAIRKRWDISDEMREQVIDTVKQCLDSHDERTKLGALRVVAALESQNQKDEHKFVDVQLHSEHARLDVVSSELGIDASIVQRIANEAGRSIGGDEDEGPEPEDFDES